MKKIHKLLTKSILYFGILASTALFSSCWHINTFSDCSGCGNRPWAPDDGGACFETKEDCEKVHSNCKYCE